MSSAAVLIGALGVKNQILVKVISLKLEPSEPIFLEASKGIRIGPTQNHLNLRLL